MKTLATIFLLIASAFAQPDAPSAVLAKINHCYQGALTPDDQITYKEIDCATVPQANWHTLSVAPRKVNFFTVRRWDEPKLRTTKQILLSPTFILEEIGMWGSTFANVEVTRNEKQNPPIPRHGELYVDAYVPLIPIAIFHFFSRKYICQCTGDGPVAYVIGLHTYNAVKGYYP